MTVVSADVFVSGMLVLVEEWRGLSVTVGGVWQGCTFSQIRQQPSVLAPPRLDPPLSFFLSPQTFHLLTENSRTTSAWQLNITVSILQRWKLHRYKIWHLTHPRWR